MSGLGSAASLLTVIGRGTRPTARATGWFGVVGLALGGALGTIWWIGALLWPPAVAAAVVLFADLALTGMIHMDGLADSADGLLPHMSRPRRLEVMALPDVGAFGVVLVATVLITRFATLATLSPSPLLLAALWGSARAAMALAITSLPYARPGGMAEEFRGARHRVAALLAIGACLCTAALWEVLAGPVAVLVGLVAASGVLSLAHRRLDGYTGDVLGASAVSAETAGLVTAAAAW